MCVLWRCPPPGHARAGQALLHCLLCCLLRSTQFPKPKLCGSTLGCCQPALFLQSQLNPPQSDPTQPFPEGCSHGWPQSGPCYRFRYVEYSMQVEMKLLEWGKDYQETKLGKQPRDVRALSSHALKHSAGHCAPCPHMGTRQWEGAAAGSNRSCVPGCMHWTLLDTATACNQSLEWFQPFSDTVISTY